MRIFWQSYVDEENGATYWQALRKHLGEAAAPGTEVQVHGITPYNSYAHPLVEFRCAREMISNAIRAEREGYDAFVVGHFQDAGLYEARAAVGIPVIGLGEASMLHACQLGQRVAVVTINPRFVSYIERQVGTYGLKDRVKDVTAMVFEPGQIMAAFHDAGAFEETKRQFDTLAEPLVASGTDVIVAGGGIPMLLFAGVRAHRIKDAPVMNGLPVALMAAETAVRLGRLNGLEASRRSDFARPPDWVLEEFLTHPKGL
ncbi:MAG: aspartate/glutamate racemase family protein [Pseudomonadota bacterium]